MLYGEVLLLLAEMLNSLCSSPDEILVDEGDVEVPAELLVVELAAVEILVVLFVLELVVAL